MPHVSGEEHHLISPVTPRTPIVEHPMATSWISFGPDLEPLESESRRGAQTPPRRRDGVRVSGKAEDVVAKLADAAGTPGAWCRLEEILDDGGRRPVFVNARAARLVSADVEPAR
jgi:hypothetical protein